ncbi:Uncharacterized protein HZ326_22826 [Fusarium oxysporum f. sp. albedinis]|nr:Uncharacterized protein HZ326_22826 [Fusarium oxysporum f. sp. albedinis]
MHCCCLVLDDGGDVKWRSWRNPFSLAITIKRRMKQFNIYSYCSNSQSEFCQFLNVSTPSDLSHRCNTP